MPRQFFLPLYQAAHPGAPAGNDMCFLVGGYNEGEAYGRVYEVIIPARPVPVEQNVNAFGLTWGGQTHIVARLLSGSDPMVIQHLKQKFTISDQDMSAASTEATQLHALKNPVSIPASTGLRRFGYPPCKDDVAIDAIYNRR
jgi:hypothetical protein